MDKRQTEIGVDGMNNIEKFQKDGYCVVKNAISSELRDFVTQYALFCETQDLMRGLNTSDVQSPGTHAKYGDPATETLLLSLQNVMEENVGFKLLPTYSYYRVYRNGNDLKRHIDRPSCEISATLCFNYSYDDTKYQWPIFIESNGVFGADLMPGDMLIYRGRDLRHWRDPLEYDDEEVWHVQGFFHYVDASGPYQNYIYDGRNNVGELRKNTIQSNSQKDYIIKL
jgi:hypothetical protein